MKKEIEEKIFALKNKFRILHEQMVVEGQALFQEVAEILFRDSRLQSFKWSQYTPFFNDGEECTFGVNDVDYINGYNEWDDRGVEDERGFNFWISCKDRRWDSNARKSVPNEKFVVADKELVGLVRGLVNGINSSVLKQMFGDHVTVLVERTPDGIKTTTEECNHD